MAGEESNIIANAEKSTAQDPSRLNSWNAFVVRAKKSKFFKDSLAYSGTNFFEQLLTIIRSFAVRRVLAPELLGFWNLMTVVQGFLGTFDLGAVSGATRELPMLGARGDDSEKRRVYGSTLWFTLIQNAVIAIIAVIYVSFHHSDHSRIENVATYAGILIFFLSSFYTVYSTFLLSNQAFVALSRISILCAAIDSIGFILGAWIWGLRGLILATIVSSVFRGVLFTWFGRHIYPPRRGELYIDSLKRLLSFGFSIRIVDYPNALFNMASILWITKFMNVESIALFSMAQGFSLQVADLSTKVGSVYTIRFLAQIGGGTSHDVIGRQLKQYLRLQLLVLLPLLSWAAFTGLTFIVNNFTPKYSEANATFLILLISGFFYVLNSGLTNPWMAEKQLLNRGIANIFGLTVITGALASISFLTNKMTIIHVAYATVVGRCLYFSYMVFAVGKKYWDARERLEILISVIMAALWTGAALYCGYLIMGPGTLGLIINSKLAFQSGLVTFLMIFPLAWYGVKKSSIMNGWST